MADKQVRYVLKGDSTDFTLAVNEAERRLRQSFKGMEASASVGSRKIATDYNKIGSAARNTAGQIKGIAIAAAAAVAGGGLSNLITNTKNWADETIKASRRLGVTFEELQRYRFAAELSGVSTEKFDASLERFGRRLGDVARTGTGQAAPALKDLNVAVTNTDGSVRAVNDVFDETVQKLSQVHDVTVRNSLAMQLFGREGIAMVQLGSSLQHLKETADELGLIITPEQAKQAEKLNDVLTILSTRLRAAVMPMVVDISKGLQKMNKNWDEAKQEISAVWKYLKFIVEMLIVRKLLQMSVGLIRVSRAAIAAAAGMEALEIATKGLEAAATLGATLVLQVALDYLVKKFSDSSDAIGEAVNRAKSETKKAMSATADELKKVQDDVVKQRKEFSDSIKKVVDGEVKVLEGNLQKEKNILKQKEKALVAAKQRTLALVKEFDKAMQQLQNAGSKGQTSYLDVTQQVFRAQQALQNGDLSKTIEEAQKAKQLILDYQKVDPSTGLALEFLMKKSKEVAVDAAKQLEKQQQDAIAKTKDTIQKIQSQLNLIQNITFDFDEVKTLANARNIIGQIEDLVKNNPVVVPIKLQDVSKPQSWNDKVGTLQPIPGYATGGHIVGPGSGISDSILAFLSNGEYVIKAAAVKRYGRELFDRLNSMRLPAFAAGGSVGAAGGQGGGSTINLHLDGKTFSLSARPSVAEDLRREVNLQQLKTGRKVHF